MEYLLDTNALVFFLIKSPRLKPTIEALITNSENSLHLSMASLWEISLKASTGKLFVPTSNSPEFPQTLERLGFQISEMTWQTIRRSTTLPYHHRDPFDRILIAESQLKGLPIISSDRKFDVYGVDRIW